MILYYDLGKYKETLLGNNDQDTDTMKKALYPIVPISLFLIGVIAACSFLTAPVKQSIADIPAPTLSPTETSTPVPTPTSTATETPVPTATRFVTPVTVSATPQFAPFCESDAARGSQCQYPIAGQSSAFCIKKSPYNLIALNDRATYEVLHEHVQCSEAGIIDGQRMITCTAPMAFYFELEVCDSSCSALSIEKGSTQCPFGYNYNNLQDCCTKETQEVNQGCTVLKLDTKSCIIDCGQFTKKSTCTNYGYACRWNGENNKCELRR
jgi:hypothetical protein